MTSEEIAKVCDESDRAWPDKNDPRMPTEVSTMIATWEVAYQMALLNEAIGGIVNNRFAQMKVMVEPGEWPIVVQQK